MKRRLLFAACLAAGSCHAVQAGHLEVTPFFGYQFGGNFEDAETGASYNLDEASCAGAILDVDLSPMTQLEFYFSRQETQLKSGGLFPTESFFDLDVDYYHIGGTYILLQGQAQPFVVGTLGATHVSPDPSNVGSLTRFSLGIGGGVRYLPTKHLGLYLAARGFFTFIDSDTIIYSESGGTTIIVSAEGLWQGQLQAGLIFRF